MRAPEIILVDFWDGDGIRPSAHPFIGTSRNLGLTDLNPSNGKVLFFFLFLRRRKKMACFRSLPEPFANGVHVPFGVQTRNGISWFAGGTRVTGDLSLGLMRTCISPPPRASSQSSEQSPAVWILVG